MSDALAREIVRSTGSWTTAGEVPRSGQRWNLEVLRGEDGSIAGRVGLSGSRLGQEGNVEGKIDGRKVYGTISDDQGELIARFHGMVTDQGINGTYRDRTGEIGHWQWEGEL